MSWLAANASDSICSSTGSSNWCHHRTSYAAPENADASQRLGALGWIEARGGVVRAAHADADTAAAIASVLQTARAVISVPPRRPAPLVRRHQPATTGAPQFPESRHRTPASARVR